MESYSDAMVRHNLRWHGQELYRAIASLGRYLARDDAGCFGAEEGPMAHTGQWVVHWVKEGPDCVITVSWPCLGLRRKLETLPPARGEAATWAAMVLGHHEDEPWA